MLISEPKLYTIEVTEDIASKIRTMAELGVFAAKNGSCEIHFDPQGNISQVIIHTYHRVIPKRQIGEVDMKGVILPHIV